MTVSELKRLLVHDDEQRMEPEEEKDPGNENVKSTDERI